MRYIIDVRFRGTGYSGWQVQANAHTVQAEVDNALSTLLKRPIETMGAGRTDAGVHALQLPTHFNYPGDLHPAFFVALNAILPDDISVTRVYRATFDKFNARYHAIARAYKYYIVFEKDPFWYQRSWWCKEPLDWEAMQKGAEVIKEYNSFQSFCKARANNKTFICDIHESRWDREGEAWVYSVKANRFLRSMVRTMVGTMYLMGRGELDEEGLRRVIESNDRRQAGPAVLADGLFLTEVVYPEGMLEEIIFP